MGSSKYISITTLVSYFLNFTVTLTTGGSSNLNNTYIQVTSSTKLNTGTNKYSICPCSDDICRIKFDFEVSMDGYLIVNREGWNFLNSINTLLFNTNFSRPDFWHWRAKHRVCLRSRPWYCSSLSNNYRGSKFSK